MIITHSFYIYKQIYLFMAVLSLPCSAGFFLVPESEGDCLVSLRGLLIAVASLVAEQVSRVCRLH